MASGFIILRDGRCFAPRWAVYDVAVKAMAEFLPRDDASELRSWLLGLVPETNDHEALGDGSWYRTSDDSAVQRHLDVRSLTLENQERLEGSILEADATDGEHQIWIAPLAEMVRRIRAGEEPLSFSHWSVVTDAPGDRVGPGWLA